MLDSAARAVHIRALYGPEEHQALTVYGDVHAALEDVGLHPYVETRGGLAVCAYADDGNLFVVACEDFLPLNREALGSLMGWHLAHVPEDEPGRAWRCVVYDTVPACLRCGEPGDLRLEPLARAAAAHLGTCPYTARPAWD